MTSAITNLQSALLTWNADETRDKKLKWMVTDHLGSMRIEADKSGSLSGMTRHDYLPFGEELGAGVGVRSSSNGYAAGLTRQRFTGYERDSETSLDYAGARYFSSMQGRFTSYDPVFVNAKRLVDPQRLNLYAYARNNPLKYVDPDGLDLLIAAELGGEARRIFKLLHRGLNEEDRKHVHLVVGNGKNGFAKGTFAVTVDKDHKSKSENFQAIQTIANDRKETAMFAIVGPKGTFASQVGVKQGDAVIIESFKGIYGQDNYVSRADALPGQTLFPLRGTPMENVIYSISKNTEVYVANDQPDIEIVATAYHELRAHVFLSNMGRDIPKGSHGYGDVDAAGKAAEAEARRNFGQGRDAPRRRR